MKTSYFLLLFTVVLLTRCGNESAPPEQQGVYLPPVPILTYNKAQSYPHDINSFTEGLLVHKGQLFESTGSPENMDNTRSLFGIVDLKTGKIDVKAELDRNRFFGEGISILNGRVYQLTYQSKVGFIYDLGTYRKLGEFTFPSAEGWGMTTDSVALIMSDGTSTLTYLDPVSFKTVKTIQVTENGNPINKLNELEYINGFLYANIWTTNIIVKIDPANGNVVSKIDLYYLNQEALQLNPKAAEMNGIAWDADKDKIYVTGKFWPNIYEIAFEH